MLQGLRRTRGVLLGAATLAAVIWGCTSEQKGGIGTDPNKVVASIIISPSSTTVPQGTTITFRYYGTTVGGDSVVPPLDWVANGGTLGPDGEFTSTGIGTVVFNAFRAADTNYNQSATTANFTLTIGKAAQSAVTIGSASTVAFGAAYTA